MPYVNVKILKDDVTSIQKRKVVGDITRSLVLRLGKKPEHIHIVIDEVDTDNWGYAGLLTTEFLGGSSTKQRPSRRPAGAGQSSSGGMW
jgi:4-oxalocrotonate tautomerase